MYLAIKELVSLKNSSNLQVASINLKADGKPWSS